MNILPPTFRKPTIIATVFCIFFTAALCRFIGINWDQNQYLDPDERFLVMVSTSMQWPHSLAQYFSTDTSSLNPHNVGYNFYVYGTWPVILVKALGDLVGMHSYGNLHLVGRATSVLTDLFTLLFIMLTTYRLCLLTASLKRFKIVATLIAGTSYAIMVLPIQLSHFFTVDPYLVCMTTLLLLILTFPPSLKTGIASGITFALAASAKLSALPLGIVFIVYSIYYLGKYRSDKKLSQLIIFALSSMIIFVCLFRVTMPYFFKDGTLYNINPKVLNNLKELESFNNPTSWYPPGIQWIHDPSLIYPAIQLLFWGIGIPFSILFLGSLIQIVKKIRSVPLLLLPLSLLAMTFLYEGIQYAMPLRYFWALFPPVSICIGIGISMILTSRAKTQKYLHVINRSTYTFISIAVLFFLSYLWSFSFLSIYLSPHTRVQASEWIYTHIQHGKTLSHEHWDDPLPLNLDPLKMNNFYTSEELPMYFPDTPQKWHDIANQLENVDYLVLSSNRVYGSITSATDHFYTSSLFYKLLFQGNLGFTPIKEFYSRPKLSLPGISICINPQIFTYGIVDKPVSACSAEGIEIVDDYAEESFTVYDHPKVTIFKKDPTFNKEVFLSKLSL